MGRPDPRRDRERHRAAERSQHELTAEATTRTRTRRFAGDVEAAKAEMKLSKYDTDKDGICDAPACKGIAH